MKKEIKKERERIIFYTTKQNKQLLKDFSELNGCSVSDICRLAVRRYIQLNSDT